MRTRVLTWHEEQLIVAREVGNREREGMGSPLPTIACSIKGKKRPGMAIGHSLTELGPARIGDRLRDEGDWRVWGLGGTSDGRGEGCRCR